MARLPSFFFFLVGFVLVFWSINWWQKALNKREFTELYKNIAVCYQGNICLAWQAARELHRKAVAQVVADPTGIDWQSAMLAYLLCELYACCGDDFEAAWLKLLARQRQDGCQNRRKTHPA